MRLITFISLIIAGLSCAGSKNAAMKPGKLNGTWVPVTQEMSGKLLPEAAFENQKLIINDSTYTVIAESIDKGVVKYRDDKMDIYGKEGLNAGKHFTAIYKYENGLLTVCYNLLGMVIRRYLTPGVNQCIFFQYQKIIYARPQRHRMKI